MPTHKNNDYKLTAVQYYLVEDKTQEEVCKNIQMHTKKFHKALRFECVGLKDTKMKEMLIFITKNQLPMI